MTDNRWEEWQRDRNRDESATRQELQEILESAQMKAFIWALETLQAKDIQREEQNDLTS